MGKPLEIDARAIARSEIGKLPRKYSAPLSRGDVAADAEQRLWGGTDARVIRSRDGQLRAHDARTGACLGAVVDEHDAAAVADLRRERERESTGSGLVAAGVAALVCLLLLGGLFYAGFHVGRAYERRSIPAEPISR